MRIARPEFDPRLLPKHRPALLQLDLFPQRRRHRLIFRLVVTGVSGLFDQLIINRQVPGHDYLLAKVTLGYTPAAAKANRQGSQGNPFFFCGAVELELSRFALDKLSGNRGAGPVANLHLQRIQRRGDRMDFLKCFHRPLEQDEHVYIAVGARFTGSWPRLAQVTHRQGGPDRPSEGRADRSPARAVSQSQTQYSVRIASAASSARGSTWCANSA